MLDSGLGLAKCMRMDTRWGSIAMSASFQFLPVNASRCMSFANALRSAGSLLHICMQIRAEDHDKTIWYTIDISAAKRWASVSPAGTCSDRTLRRRAYSDSGSMSAVLRWDLFRMTSQRLMQARHALRFTYLQDTTPDGPRRSATGLAWTL